MNGLIYRYATSEPAARIIAKQEQLLGRRTYILQLRNDYFEIRSWK